MKGVISMSKRMSWEDIKKEYPDMWVGLTDVNWLNSANIESAVVAHTEKDMSTEELDELGFEGKIVVIYTTPDSTPSIGALMA